jgi:hypothetical protein
MFRSLVWIIIRDIQIINYAITKWKERYIIITVNLLVKVMCVRVTMHGMNSIKFTELYFSYKHVENVEKRGFKIWISVKLYWVIFPEKHKEVWIYASVWKRHVLALPPVRITVHRTELMKDTELKRLTRLLRRHSWRKHDSKTSTA